ncbi:MAG: CopG family antitoxin [Caldilineaceae bacterium]
MNNDDQIRTPSATDSIEALAQFWDTHDVTDFDDELEEVTAPVFERKSGITIQIELPEKELKAIQRIAQEQRIDDTTLIRNWVLEKLYYTEMMRRVIEEFQTQ